jgi:spermidine synthase
VKPWDLLDRVETTAGPLALHQRGPRDFLITISGRVLMNSTAQRSEQALGELACARLASRAGARVLLGGLGMGITLRAALDVLPQDVRVHVFEIHPAVIGWCRGPLAPLTHRCVDEPRVRVSCGDVADEIASVASGRVSRRFDAILLDLYEGPLEKQRADSDPFFGPAALKRTRGALARDGCFATWAEDPDPAFEGRLRRAGFQLEKRRPGRGGRRHVVYLATPAPPPKA